jgi:hypothetical protein
VISVSIDRPSLSLPPLVISQDFTAGLYLPEDGAVWPNFETRRTYASDSAYVSGRMLLAAVQGAAELPLTIYAKAASGAALEASKAELEAALGQWSYALTLTVDSVAHVYRAEVVLGLPWGPIDSGMVAAHMARTSFSIPLNP